MDLSSEAVLIVGPDGHITDMTGGLERISGYSRDQAVGMTREGNEINRKEILALMDLKLRIQNRKDKIVKMMVGDRQEKYKKQAALKQKEGDDMSTSMSTLKKELLSMEQKAKELNKKFSQENAIEVVPEESLTPDDLIGELSGS